MKKYEVELFQVAKVTYEVEANSLEEAIKKAGADEQFISYEVQDEIIDTIGMHFDEARELGIDTEAIRAEYNVESNDEYINGLSAIKEIK